MTGTVLVLGAGTPNGVGGAISAKFAAAGHQVVVTGRTQEKIDQTAIADTFLMVHNQHRSARTHQLDLRPFKEVW